MKKTKMIVIKGGSEKRMEKKGKSNCNERETK